MLTWTGSHILLAYIRQSIDLMCFSSDIQEVSMTYTINYQISKVAASLTESLIKYTYAQAWDGKYPTFYGGSSSTIPFIDLR